MAHLTNMTASHWKECLVALALVFLAGGCGESPSPPRPAPANAPGLIQPTIQALVTVRWAGTDAITRDTNSVFVREIAKLPESVRLAEQTVDKLAAYPWRLRNLAPDMNTAGMIKSVLGDLPDHEVWFELAAAGESISAALAVRLNPAESDAWQSNLTLIAQSITGADPSGLPDNRQGWISEPLPFGNEWRLVLTRVHDWMFLGVADGLADFDRLTKILVEKVAEQQRESNVWIEITADMSALARVYSIPTNAFTLCPLVQIAVDGEKEKVRTRAALKFAQPLKLELSSWNVPTNLMERPTASFSAFRGMEQLLSASKAWQKLGLEPAPRQFYTWALAGEARFSYFAAETSDAKELVRRVSELLVPNGKGWTNESGLAGFKKSDRHDGVEWQGMPFLWPFLQSVVTNNQSFAVGGVFVDAPIMEPLSPEFYEEALRPNDLVFYGWENSGPRIGQWLFIAQFFRFAFGKAQLPFEGPEVLWLKALEPRLGESVTRIHLTQPDELRLTRSSSLGLTAIELHLLADWLASPQFPRGLNTFLGEPMHGSESDSSQ